MKKKKYEQVYGLGNMKIPSSGKLLYLLFISCADKKGEIRGIPLRSISLLLGISKSCVSRNVKLLRKSGYLSVQPKYTSNGMRTINTYSIK